MGKMTRNVKRNIVQLTLSWIMLKNGQTYFKNLAV